MQLSISFAGPVVLPLAHKHAVQAMLYQLLADKPEYATCLHNSGYAAGGKSFRLFTFSDLRGSYRIENRQIIFAYGCHLLVRSCIPKLMQTLLEAASAHQEAVLCGQRLCISSISPSHPELRITGSKLEIYTLSPVTVHTTLANGETVYYAPDQSRFCQALVMNAVRKWSAWKPGVPTAGLRISALPISYRKIVTSYKHFYITAYSGRFLLEGDPAMLQFLYNTGIGSKNAQGFGMFEMENS